MRPLRLVLAPLLLAFVLPLGALPAAAAPAPAATIQIGDSSYAPWSVTVPAGSVVSWVNVGTQVHTATSISTSGSPAFDTGGLAPGQSQALAFTMPGTFVYSSAPDCLNGNVNQGFNCDGPYTVTVTGGSPVVVTAVPDVRPAPASLTVYVDDNDGFQPNTLTITAGQTITFVNRGQNTHTAMSDAGIQPAWNTGGIGPGQAVSLNFATPGAYPFHSSTEPIWGHDAFGQTVILDYVWKGLITVR